MITHIMNTMLSRRFSRIRFRFTRVDPGAMQARAFGLYVHVPFCTQFCSCCPFYKVKYRKQLKQAYLQALFKELELRQPEGECSWVYLGGGTPNLLTPAEVASILSRLRKSVKLREVGMEGNPNLFTPEYLEGVREAGVEKVSMGVETFSEHALAMVNRHKCEKDHVAKAVGKARELGMSVNVDMLLGLPGQDRELCLSDVATLSEMGPSQITIYPFLTIRGVEATPSMDDHEMFRTIEEAGHILGPKGYVRENVWTFRRTETNAIYDSSGAELVNDYLGFGPTAFSRVGMTQVVNPALELYLKMMGEGAWRAFRCDLDEGSAAWRSFAHELYNLEVDETAIGRLPRGVRLVLAFLRLTGHVRGSHVTGKGRYAVHSLTRAVVESLPFPIQNPDVVVNWADYDSALASERSDSSPGR